MARLLRHLRVTKRAQDGLPAIVLAYTPGRGVLAAVAQPRNPLLARGVIEVVRQRQSWRDPDGVPLDALPAVRFQPYNPEDFRTPIPWGARQTPDRERHPHRLGLAPRGPVLIRHGGRLRRRR